MHKRAIFGIKSFFRTLSNYLLLIDELDMTQNFSIGDTRNCTNSESSNNCTINVEVGCSYKQKEDTLHQSLDWDITVQANCSSGEDGGGGGEKLFCLLQDPELEHIPTATVEIRFYKKNYFFFQNQRSTNCIRDCQLVILS